MITVDVFAGAISMGTLATLPIGFPNGTFMTKLLAIASLVFTTSLYTTLAILYVLRGEARDTPPSRRRAVISLLLLYLAFAVMFSGFIVLNIVLIAGGQGAVGYSGIAMLSAIPLWFFLYSKLERSGWLEDRPQEAPAAQPPLAERPVYYTNKHFIV